MNGATPSIDAWTRATLRALGIRPRKRLGQNFLIAERAVEAIVALIDPQPTDQLVEIGGGLGVLTRELAARAGRVVVFELDPVLNAHLEAMGGTQVLGDALGEWQQANALLDPSQPVKIAGNIPYQITAPLLAQCFEHPLAAGWSSLTLMVQEEVAQRMLAPAGDSERSRLSVLVEFHALADRTIAVPAGSFYPAPRVDSRVVHLRPRPVPLLEPGEFDAFGALIKQGFGMRRKTLWNNLRAGIEPSQSERLRAGLEANTVDVGVRPQEVSLRHWLTIFWVLCELGLTLRAKGATE